MAKVDADHAARLRGHKSFLRRLLERWRAPGEDPSGDLHSSHGTLDDPGEKPLPSAPPATVNPSAYLEPAKLLLSSGTAIVAVSGAALYAIVAFGYQRFYGDLGVAPHDVFYDPDAQKTISRSRSHLELAFIPYQYWRNGSPFIYYTALKGFCR